MSQSLKISLAFTACLALTACDSKDTKKNDSMLESAYARCVQQMSADIQKDNPTISDPMILKSMLSAAKQVCHSSIFKTCKKDQKSQSCQLILNQYQ